MRKPIEIVGAGPAGLSAALTITSRGGQAVVYERHSDVGRRFHGDFQGLENWTVDIDVLDEFASIGVEPTFEYTPFTEAVFFDPNGREYVFRSARPIWYLVRRGSDAGTLDQSLRRQALDAGAEIRFNTVQEHLPNGGIVAHGPRRPDAIAVGYIFDCDRANGAFSVAAEELAPKGYSYLLICNGRATVASCLFQDFHNEATYLERTVDFFTDKVGITLVNARRFGGYGNLLPVRNARKGRMLYVGEAAGLQDALFGFGIRYAVLSGHLAGRAFLEGGPKRYRALLDERFDSLLKAAVVNRYFYEKLGNRGYVKLLRRVERAADVGDWLRAFYGSGHTKSLLYPVAHRKLSRKPDLIRECAEGCDCTWCRCGDRAACACRSRVSA
ncbi:MAG: NAD(P)/FAD-dependent oxidoreductase [Gemmatimonadales bacterium]